MMQWFILYFKSNKPLFILFFIWTLSEILINPIGNFPLNDDWAYAKDVQNLVLYNKFELSNWQVIPLLTQIIYGYLVCIPFGFSFTVLRFSTIIISAIGIFFSYKIAIKASVNKNIAAISAAIIAFNPIYLQLTNTFMSDVPFLTMSIIASFYFIQFEKKEKPVDFFWAVLFTCLALMSRQIGIVISIAFCLSWLLLKKRNLKNFFIAFSPILVSLFFLFTYQHIIAHFDKLPIGYNFQFFMLIDAVLHPTFEILKKVAFYLITASIGLGIFITPIILPLIKTFLKKNIFSKAESITLLAISTTYFLIIIVKLYLTNYYIPFSGNIIYSFGLGPVIMPDAISYALTTMNGIEKFVWISLTIIGTVSILFFIAIIIDVLKRMKQRKYNFFQKTPFQFVFFSGIIILYIVPLSFIYISDRYLIFVLVFLIYILSAYIPLIDNTQFLKFYSYRIVLFFLPILLFSIAATHDYLAWNKARWHALNYLVYEQKISPKEIDGGFEFNAWYLFDFSKYHPEINKKWWWVEKDNYLVTMSLVKGTSLIKKYNYYKWLSLKESYVFITKRTSKAIDPICRIKL